MVKVSYCLLARDLVKSRAVLGPFRVRSEAMPGKLHHGNPLLHEIPFFVIGLLDYPLHFGGRGCRPIGLDDRPFNDTRNWGGLMDPRLNWSGGAERDMNTEDEVVWSEAVAGGETSAAVVATNKRTAIKKN